jgi:hypothetical protein
MEEKLSLKRLPIKELSDYLHVKDNRSIESWCKKNELDIHVENSRKYVYCNDLNTILENIYKSDTKTKHPEDYLDRCFPNVSFQTIIKLSGMSENNITITSDPYKHFPPDVAKFLKSFND